MTPTNSSNPWWSVFKEAIEAVGGKLGKPEILSSTTDARYMRKLGIPALGFSPMTNTPILLHDHNEVCKVCQLSLYNTAFLVLMLIWFFSYLTMFYSSLRTPYTWKESRFTNLWSVHWVPLPELLIRWFEGGDLQGADEIFHHFQHHGHFPLVWLCCVPWPIVAVL